VPTLSTVCPDSMLGTSWASVLEMCSGAVGEGLMFSLCHDTQLGVEVCSHDTRDDLRRICENSAAAEEHTALGPATSTSFFDHFSDHYGPVLAHPSPPESGKLDPALHAPCA